MVRDSDAAFDLMHELFSTPLALELLSALATGRSVHTRAADATHTRTAIAVLKQLQLIEPDAAQSDRMALTAFGQDVVGCLDRAEAYAEHIFNP